MDQQSDTSYIDIFSNNYNSYNCVILNNVFLDNIIEQYDNNNNN